MSTEFRSPAEHGARVLGLTLSPEQLDQVAANLELLSRHASVVLAVALPPEIEPAPVFVP